jgi:hypothetical protein
LHGGSVKHSDCGINWPSWRLAGIALGYPAAGPKNFSKVEVRRAQGVLESASERLPSSQRSGTRIHARQDSVVVLAQTGVALAGCALELAAIFDDNLATAFLDRTTFH